MRPNALDRGVSTVLKAGAAYFAAVFGAGFVFGTIRVLLVVPRFGERVAELMESPLMLVVIAVAATWVVRRFGMPPAPGRRLAVGCIALGLLLCLELTLVLKLRGLTIAEYLRSRDPVSGTVYELMLGVIALMPVLVARGTVSGGAADATERRAG